MQKITIERIDKMSVYRKESYKTLRTNIEFTGKDVKVISVTSCMPNEGKSNVALNVALSLTETGKKILFIDADMRKSTLIGRYRIKNAKKGLSHYLSGQCTEEEALGETNIEGLHMILSGTVPPNPSELLSGDIFSEYLKRSREKYDYVIIDCPPLGSVVDALIPGKLSDGVVLIVEAEVTGYKMAQRIKKQLEMAGCKILGVVLNKANIRGDIYYRDYYGKCYMDEE